EDGTAEGSGGADPELDVVGLFGYWHITVSARVLFDYRSSGLRPVRLAIRASMRGPTSSPS
ncbi:MAG TPA: hypothetical protein VGD27_06365, partial [Longimicrobiales bacterium]